jgi:hypothetical protein
MTFLGVDPGVGGGLACLTADGGVIWAIPMPQTDEALLLALRDAGPAGGHRACRAVLEKVRSSPQMGVVSSFTFGMQYGRCRMALAAEQIPFEEVSPVVWQRRMDCFHGGQQEFVADSYTPKVAGTASAQA